MAKVTAAIKNRFPTSWLPKWESVFKVPYWVRLGQRVFPSSRCSASVSACCESVAPAGWASFFLHLGGMGLILRPESVYLRAATPSYGLIISIRPFVPQV